MLAFARRPSSEHAGSRALRRRNAREIAEAFGRIDAATQSISRKSGADLLTVHTVPSFGRLMLPFGTEGPQLSCHCLNCLRSRARIRKIKVFREWLRQELKTEPEDLAETPTNV